MKSRIGLSVVAAGVGGVVALGGAQVVHATSAPATTYHACIDGNHGLNAANPDGSCPAGQTPTSWPGALSSSTGTQLTKSVASQQKSITAAEANMKSSLTQVRGTARKIAGLDRRFRNETTVSAQIGTLGDMSQQSQLEIQQLVDQLSKFDETLSNVLKKFGDTQSSIVKNLK
jgi:hypothetical protein